MAASKQFSMSARNPSARLCPPRIQIPLSIWLARVRLARPRLHLLRRHSAGFLHTPGLRLSRPCGQSCGQFSPNVKALWWSIRVRLGM